MDRTTLAPGLNAPVAWPGAAVPLTGETIHREDRRTAVIPAADVISPRVLGAARITKWLRYAGPGLMVSVGYMDPGNWATDIEAGSRYGNALLFVVGLASLAAMLLQTLALRLGLVSGFDLATGCRKRYPAAVNFVLWLLAEAAIIACDLAEVLGSALALHLLFGVSTVTGVCITAFDTLLVLGLRTTGMRQLEAIVLGLVASIMACFVVELVLVGPQWSSIASGFVPRLSALRDPDAIYLAVAIVGATVMPHNLYLHSALVIERRGAPGDHGRTVSALRLSTWDTVGSLGVALMVNAAILALAATAFHAHGYTDVRQIDDAYRLLDPVVGSALASVLFGIALLAAGQSSTLTGTMAGQIVLDGFLGLKVARWKIRLATRLLALLPALAGLLWMGEDKVGQLLVASQVVLSFQLPFAIWPLIRITGDRRVMGAFVNGMALTLAAWSLFAAIVLANAWLVLH